MPKSVPKGLPGGLRLTAEVEADGVPRIIILGAAPSVPESPRRIDRVQEDKEARSNRRTGSPFRCSGRRACRYRQPRGVAEAKCAQSEK
jgi:hypothetical protein